MILPPQNGQDFNSIDIILTHLLFLKIFIICSLLHVCSYCCWSLPHSRPFVPVRGIFGFRVRKISVQLNKRHCPSFVYGLCPHFVFVPVLTVRQHITMNLVAVKSYLFQLLTSFFELRQASVSITCKPQFFHLTSIEFKSSGKGESGFL